MKVIVVLVLSAAICGCSINYNMEMKGLTLPEQPFVINKLKEDSYPGYMAAEGNIYSCRYGIHYMTSKEMSPPKHEIFASLLAKYKPGVENKSVTLNRFDVYYNQRLRDLSTAAPAAGGALGGIIGASVSSSISAHAASQHGSFVYEDMHVEVKPEDIPIDENKKYVGCKGRGEGEYPVGVVSKGHDVVVTWLNFEIEEKTYSFKTYYQTQLDESGGVPNAVRVAIDKSIKTISNMIE